MAGRRGYGNDPIFSLLRYTQSISLSLSLEQKKKEEKKKNSRQSLASRPSARSCVSVCKLDVNYKRVSALLYRTWLCGWSFAADPGYYCAAGVLFLSLGTTCSSWPAFQLPSIFRSLFSFFRGGGASLNCVPVVLKPTYLPTGKPENKFGKRKRRRNLAPGVRRCMGRKGI